MPELILSDKYKDFLDLRRTAPVEFLEGTTSAGKTTVGIVRFMLKVADSPKQLHIISGLDTGTIEKNIINKDLGIVDVFGDAVEYNASGRGVHSLPHIIYHTLDKNGDLCDKVIYILGYDNKTRWKKALGGQYGCVYIDEINIADMEYVREVSMRCDYFMGTLNPDNPELPIYKEYVNCARPLERYKDDAPVELLRQLNSPPKDGWVWWFFTFHHNAGLSDAKIKQIIQNVPVGTKLYKNKILGLRGKATGLVFSNFNREKHLVRAEDVKPLIKGRDGERFEHFTAGLDTAYSSSSPDTIAMSFMGITNKGNAYLLDERTYNNANLDEPIAPSDTVENFVDFLERNRKEWGFAKDVFIDSADQATITEFKKYKRKRGIVYNFTNAHKKVKIIDRINLQLGWFAQENFFIVDTCKTYINELESYSWKDNKDNTPEDGNDHMVNSVQYAWIPFKHLIGKNRK